MLPISPGPRGRGAGANPPNRFVPLSVELDPEELGGPGPATSFFQDTTRRIVVRNDSPDVGFEYSVNPYRGCEHGCIYCYARPTHEYLGLSAGLDFESKIFVKTDAPDLLKKELSSSRWRPTPIAMSGVTDPYQPVERRLELTRGCLQVLAEFGNPVMVITKNRLIERDVDLLAKLAGDGAASVSLSVTTLRPELQRVMEPRTSTPSGRLGAIRRLSAAGIPVGVMVAPVIPGLTDHELPAILEAAAEAGAVRAGYIVLRLPHGVRELFDEWLLRHFPERRGKVIGRVRDVRGGRLNDPRFRSRMKGEGEYAEQIGALFRISCARLGLNRESPRLSVGSWRGPRKRAAEQLSLL